MTISTVSPKYQVTIPKEVRKYFDFIEPYRKVHVRKSKDGKQIIIEPKKDIVDFVGILGEPKIKFKTDVALKEATRKSKSLYYKKKYGTRH